MLWSVEATEGYAVLVGDAWCVALPGLADLSGCSIRILL
jgi:hypothetical protein